MDNDDIHTTQPLAATAPPHPSTTDTIQHDPARPLLQGLEEIAALDHVLVKQKMERLEFLVGSSANNKYRVFDGSGQLVLYVAENSDAFERSCCGDERTFNLKLFNSDRVPVLTMTRLREDSWMECCVSNYSGPMEIFTARGGKLGSVTQVWDSMSHEYYSVRDERGREVFKVTPPRELFSRHRKFFVTDSAGANIGEMKKQWAGAAKELFSSADNYGVSFPANMNVIHKAVLICTCIMLVSIGEEGEISCNSLTD